MNANVGLGAKLRSNVTGQVYQVTGIQGSTLELKVDVDALNGLLIHREELQCYTVLTRGKSLEQDLRDRLEASNRQLEQAKALLAAHGIMFNT